MHWSRTLNIVGAHAEGEVGRVITGGVIDLPGRTMIEKMEYLNNVDDRLRRITMFEPRGSAQMSVNLLVPPCTPGADAGFIVMQADACHAMSGSNAMCVATVLLETGMLPMVEPETNVTLDTPAGLVVARCRCRNGKVEQVSVDMPPAFVEYLDHPLELDDGKRITVDVAYGGAYYCMVRAEDFGFRIGPGEARAMVDVGRRIRAAALKQIQVQHPEISQLNRIEAVMYCSRFVDVAAPIRSGTVIYPGRMDRSPCGTGTAARLAVLHARGQVEAGQHLTQMSAINSRFIAEILGTAKVGNRPAVLTRVSGRAWIYSVGQLGVDPTDPYPIGYCLPDTWGPDVHPATLPAE
jgi:proline racemase